MAGQNWGARKKDEQLNFVDIAEVRCKIDDNLRLFYKESDDGRINFLDLRWFKETTVGKHTVSNDNFGKAAAANKSDDPNIPRGKERGTRDGIAFSERHIQPLIKNFEYTLRAYNQFDWDVESAKGRCGELLGCEVINYDLQMTVYANMPHSMLECVLIRFKKGRDEWSAIRLQLDHAREMPAMLKELERKIETYRNYKNMDPCMQSYFKFPGQGPDNEDCVNSYYSVENAGGGGCGKNTPTTMATKKSGGGGRGGGNIKLEDDVDRMEIVEIDG
jgi:hypothetical protein